jgi:hypothetical protein
MLRDPLSEGIKVEGYQLFKLKHKVKNKNKSEGGVELERRSATQKEYFKHKSNIYVLKLWYLLMLLASTTADCGIIGIMVLVESFTIKSQRFRVKQNLKNIFLKNTVFISYFAFLGVYKRLVLM